MHNVFATMQEVYKKNLKQSGMIFSPFSYVERRGELVIYFPFGKQSKEALSKLKEMYR